MINKTNTQLPQVQPPAPKKENWFASHYLWGYAFLALAFLLAVAFIYQMENKEPQEAQVCIQVITSAKNPETGEVKEFPTPCDVPENWQVIESVNPAQPLTVYTDIERKFEITNIGDWEARIIPINGLAFSSPSKGGSIYVDVYEGKIAESLDQLKTHSTITRDESVLYADKNWRIIEAQDKGGEKFYSGYYESNGVVYRFTVNAYESDAEESLSFFLTNFNVL